MDRPTHDDRHQLQPHPESPAAARGFQVWADVDFTGNRLRLRYGVDGDVAALRIPAPSRTPARTDGLWQGTCFEAFVRADGAGYGEYNFAPSGDWAAYRFTGYRAGMAPLAEGPAPSPASGAAGTLALEAVVDLGWLATNPGAPLRLGLATVLRHANGEASYWALAHPPGKPDFHHATGFAIALR